MKIRCIHGYFQFFESYPGEISRIASRHNWSFKPVDEYHTFEKIAEAETYSIPLLPYAGIPATAVYAGKPWEVFEANGFVYDFQKDLVVPISSVPKLMKVVKTGNYFISDGLILPGSRDLNGQVTGYTCYYDWSLGNFKYTEVTYA